MKKQSMHVRRMVLLGILAAGAMVLSYIEMLLPPLLWSVPGIKMGLPNLVIIFTLYRMGWREAGIVSLLRLVVSALLFGSVVTLLYSLAGALLSFGVMLFLKRLALFSPVGVSVAGGVAHNIGQILVAVWLLRTPSIAYYMIVLSVSGTVAGALIGLAAGLALHYTRGLFERLGMRTGEPNTDAENK